MCNFYFKIDWVAVSVIMFQLIYSSSSLFMYVLHVRYAIILYNWQYIQPLPVKFIIITFYTIVWWRSLSSRGGSYHSWDLTLTTDALASIEWVSTFLFLSLPLDLPSYLPPPSYPPLSLTLPSLPLSSQFPSLLSSTSVLSI